MVDGDDNGVIGLVATRLHRIIKHFTPVDAVHSGIGLFASVKRWEALDPQVKQWIEQAARLSGEQGAVEFDALVKQAFDALPGLGVQVHGPDDSFRSAAEQVIKEMEGEYWPAGLVAKIRDVR